MNESESESSVVVVVVNHSPRQSEAVYESLSENGSRVVKENPRKKKMSASKSAIDLLT